MAQFVDWDLAAATAATLGRSGPGVSYAEAAEVVADLRRLADEAAEHVLAYTQLRPRVDDPGVRVVDRRDWAAANIAGLREVVNPLTDRLRHGIAALADAVRDPASRASVLDLVQTPAQRRVLERLTALMTLLEGHAEFVMDGVGPDVVPTVESIRAKFTQRRDAASGLERVLRKLLGIEVKLRQYAEGRKF